MILRPCTTDHLPAMSSSFFTKPNLLLSSPISGTEYRPAVSRFHEKIPNTIPLHHDSWCIALVACPVCFGHRIQVSTLPSPPPSLTYTGNQIRLILPNAPWSSHNFFVLFLGFFWAGIISKLQTICDMDNNNTLDTQSTATQRGFFFAFGLGGLDCAQLPAQSGLRLIGSLRIIFWRYPFCWLFLYSIWFSDGWHSPPGDKGNICWDQSFCISLVLNISAPGLAALNLLCTCDVTCCC